VREAGKKLERLRINACIIMLDKSKRKYPVFLHVIVSALVFYGCTAKSSVLKTEDYIIRERGKMPFLLRFPADVGVINVNENSIAAIEKKEHKSAIELWTLARFYHVLSKKNNLTIAEGLYREISDRDGIYRFIALTNRACILFEIGKYRDSEEMFQALIDERSPDISTYYNLYLLYKFTERLEDGIKVLSIIMDRFPDNIFAFVELGDILMGKEKYSMSEELYKKALAVDKSSYIPWCRLARLKKKMKNYAESEYYYDTCISHFPQDQDVYIDYSRMLISINKINKAKKIIKMGLKRFGTETLREGIQ
jgi:tetratricopeptide (TPR) repeat protein